MKNNKFRKVVLDIETTGINFLGTPYLGHKIIEIGAVEIIDRNITNKIFHTYLQPNRKIEKSAFYIHGISDQFLIGKPIFNEISDRLLEFIKDSELIIHNADFDIGFLNYELSLINFNFLKIENICKIIDTLSIARKLFPGKKNNLDALSLRYKIPIDRKKHSALLDAKILSKLYLLMTIKQNDIDFNQLDHKQSKEYSNFKLKKTKLLSANFEENNNHNDYLNNMKKEYGTCLWNDKT